MPSDEVESLTSARAGAMAGTEPSDALRVSTYYHNVQLLRANVTHTGCECPVDAIG